MKYKTYRNTLKSTIQIAERDYYQKEFTLKSHDIKSTWKIINSILNSNTKTQNEITLFIDNELVSNPDEIVRHFNKFFSEIGAKLAKNVSLTNKSIYDFLPPPNPNSMVLLPTDLNEVLNILSSLECKTSAGPDEIPVTIMKKAGPFIAYPLVKIINSSLSNGIFPDRLKPAKVIPIFNNGDKTNLNNYRPISVLNSFSKVFEKVILNRILQFLKKSNFFFEDQFGFKAGHSTSMALASAEEFITQSLDKNEIPLAIFIDLSKAFDSLDHKLLLQKLAHSGIRGVALNLITSYLSGRTQSVFYNNTSSPGLPITHGVPQGSILGPLLFLCYINDLHNCSPLIKYLLFADDTTLLFSAKTIEDLFQTINLELTTVTCWFLAN